MTQIKPTKNHARIAWLDLARAFAILTVILCHCVGRVYPLYGDEFVSIGMPSQIASVSLFTVGRLGVPIFLFISGYLLLDRYYDRKACLNFWKTKLLGLLFATEVWIVLYSLFLWAVKGTTFNIVTLVESMLFLRNIDMAHMWYMPMILGMYLFLPFIANGLKVLDDARILAGPLCAACVMFFVPPHPQRHLAIDGQTSHRNINSRRVQRGSLWLLYAVRLLHKKENIQTMQLDVHYGNRHCVIHLGSLTSNLRI